MSKKLRYSFPTNFRQKRSHKKMMQDFGARFVSVEKSYNGDETLYFSVKNNEEASRAEALLGENNIKFLKVE